MANGIKQKRIITVLLIAFIFIFGIITGSIYTSRSSNQITKFLKQSELDAESFLIEQELFQTFETSCELAKERLDILGTELWNLGKLLDDPNAKKRLGEDNYSILKRKYHLMQIRTYTLDKKLQDDCEDTFNIILFYFKQNDLISKEQGQILDELVEEYDLHVFAIEYDYAKELAFLEQYYEITETPTIVVNYKEKFKGLTPKEKIIPLLYGR